VQVCYYRDKNSINKFQIAKVTADGVDVCEPFALETNWDLKVRAMTTLYPISFFILFIRVPCHAL